MATTSISICPGSSRFPKATSSLARAYRWTKKSDLDDFLFFHFFAKDTVLPNIAQDQHKQRDELEERPNIQQYVHDQEHEGYAD